MFVQRLFRAQQGRRSIVTSTAQIMLPDHANSAGNVHGGSILRLIDECAIISASRYAVQNAKQTSSSSPPPPTVALVRVESVDFENPMHIGNLAQLDARVVSTGKTSMEVEVNVFAESITTGLRKRTNKARLWYTLVDRARGRDKQMPPKLAVCDTVQVPPFQHASKEEEELARTRYLEQKAARNNLYGLDPTASMRRPDSVPVLSHFVLPSDCSEEGFIFGGVLMKLMDTAAGVEAMRYCHTNCVTANIESLNFLSPTYMGNIVKVYAHPTYSSAKTLEVAVFVTAEDVFTGESWRAVNAHFVFVSLDENGNTLPIRPLQPLNHESRHDYELGKQRYLKRKEMRSKAMEK